ncbi:MAG: 4-amino-4-deoxy-L-arabinose transferase [Nocardioides sp.]
MSLRETAEDVVRRTLAAPATLGRGRLLCVDGPAGSGKSTLAAAVLAAVPSSVTSTVMHLDDVYPGWSGLAEGVDRVARLLVEPLARSEPGGYRRYDWVAGAAAEWHDVPPVELLVLEGVGAGALDYADRITTLVWVDAPREVRLARGVARDVALYGPADAGEELRVRWLRWMKDEDAFLAEHRTRERADIEVWGTPV